MIVWVACCVQMYAHNMKCIGCLGCEKKCKTVRTPQLQNQCDIPLRAYNTDDKARISSASGGVFSAIAKQAIQSRNAIVYGATLKGNRVYHAGIESIDDICKLQGSKYIQSNTQGIYREVCRRLKENRFVVFSGTPCQVQALDVILAGKAYPNLLTIDLICHGIISNKIFQRHIEKTKCGEVLSFRDKSLGWGTDVYFRTKKDGKVTVDQNWRRNFFYHVFQIETCARHNCYKCQFCSPQRVSDITIGDYWADRRSENYDSLGISSLLCNTEKGKDFIEKCNNVHTDKVEWLSTIKPNPRLIMSRAEFLKFSCSRYIGKLYRYLPSSMADAIVGIWKTKRLLLFWPWLSYIESVKQKYESRYQNEVLSSCKLFDEDR